MTLVVQSQNTLDTLQSLVEEHFMNVPNNGQKIETFDEFQSNPFDGPKFAGKLYKLLPVKNTYRVDLYWSLPSLLHMWKEKPLHYLSWIIGHEGSGSIISYLRKRVWALELFAGNAGDGFEHNSICSLFSISVILTKEGFENVDKVVNIIFAYLEMMKKRGSNERIFREIQKIEQLDFDFCEEKQPIDNVENLSQNMQYYPAENYLNGDDLMLEFNGKLISQSLDCLR